MRSNNNDLLERMSITLDLFNDYSESAQILAKEGRKFRSLRIANQKTFSFAPKGWKGKQKWGDLELKEWNET